MPKRRPKRDRGRLVVVSTSAVEAIEIACACGGHIVIAWKSEPPELRCPSCGADLTDDAMLVVRCGRLFLRRDLPPLALRIRTTATL